MNSIDAPGTFVYRVNPSLDAADYLDLLDRSGLGERRPMGDPGCIREALAASNLVIGAWRDGTLVGASRCVTDFRLCCYMADLAVDRNLQRAGIGVELVRHTRQALGPRCTIILLAAPAAADYYPRIGFRFDNRCWVLGPRDVLEGPVRPAEDMS
jgi:ribosomal protein S18 acetylase RimI-like enzyme